MNEKELKSDEMKELFKAFAKLKTSTEAKKFLRDICTLSELKSMSERLQVAKKIIREEPYRQISKETGSSTATVTRVAYWLKNGMGGYGTVLNRLGHHKSSSSRRRLS
jgi:TrpR-related protein YerC/YecD